MKSAFESIKQGLLEAIEFAEGRDNGTRIYLGAVDVKKLRQQIGLNRSQFATLFGISPSTIRHWENGDRTPKGPALVLLNLIHHQPEVVLKAIHK